MYTTAELDEYLAEIRTQVCAHCVERLPGAPPCAPLGKLCGVEQNLPNLIDAVHGVFSDSIVPYFESKQHQVCERCAFRNSKFCPCPMDYLLVLVVEAIETVDARHERRAQGRQHLLDLGSNLGGDAQEIRRLYEEATGTWAGCDWPTRFGESALNLNGVTAAEARHKAATYQGKAGAADWEAAADWLARVEQHAARAEEHAAQAMRAVAAGDWHEAFVQARLAWTSEFATGRIVWCGFPMTWQRFYLGVEAAVALHPVAAQTAQAVAR